jgi:hypothetical protein
VYGQHARFVVVFLSKEYLSSVVPMDELFAAMTQDVRRRGGCILPVLVGKVDVPPSLISPHIGYLEAKNFTPDQLAHELHIKVLNAKALGKAGEVRGLRTSPVQVTGIVPRARGALRNIPVGIRRALIALLVGLLAVAGLVLVPETINPAPRPNLMETPGPTSSAPPPTRSRIPLTSPPNDPLGPGGQLPVPPSSPPPSSKPPVVRPTIEISRGEDSESSNCAEPDCSWVTVVMNGFPPNTEYEVHPYNHHEFSSPAVITTDAHGHGVCDSHNEDSCQRIRYDVPDSTIYVYVDTSDGQRIKSKPIYWEPR